MTKKEKIIKKFFTDIKSEEIRSLTEFTPSKNTLFSIYTFYGYSCNVNFIKKTINVFDSKNTGICISNFTLNDYDLTKIKKLISDIITNRNIFINDVIKESYDLFWNNSDDGKTEIYSLVHNLCHKQIENNEFGESNIYCPQFDIVKNNVKFRIVTNFDFGGKMTIYRYLCDDGILLNEIDVIYDDRISKLINTWKDNKYKYQHNKIEKEFYNSLGY